jgi:sugar O-acyltransferase (sialic acid O-acetyltransferase NeuD family)
MKGKSNLILIGGGGHCKSVLEIVEKTDFNVVGVLDTLENVGKTILYTRIIGTDDDISRYVSDSYFLVTVGHILNPNLRINLHEKVVNAGGKFATIISHSAVVSKYSKIGVGTVVMNNVVINADTIIGDCCIINTFANIEHDAYVGNFCHISTGAMINGNCVVYDNVFIGSQSVLVNGISISKDCVVAAGSVVRKNILVSGVYSGNPAIM